MWVHLFGILSPVSESLPLQQMLFFKLGYVRTDGKAFYNMLLKRPTGGQMLYDSISECELLVSSSARAPFRNHVNETTQLHKASF